MKKQLKGFVSGVLATVLVLGLIGTAVATVGRKTVEVDYNDIKVTMNGSAVNLVDANGAPVEPFAINGTTYLPVRAVAGALGLDVGWDGASKTVKLTTKLSIPTGALIMDKNDVKVYYNGIVESTGYFGGCDIKLTIENNSDKDITIYVDDFSVNGFMVNAYLGCSVAAGKKANDSITISQPELDEAGIVGPINEAEFVFRFGENGTINYVESDIIKL